VPSSVDFWWAWDVDKETVMRKLGIGINLLEKI
jgi:hypothetical protein